MGFTDKSSTWFYKKVILANDLNALGINCNILRFQNITITDDIIIDENITTANNVNFNLNPTPIICDNFTIESGYTFTGNLFIIAKSKIEIAGSINATEFGCLGGHSNKHGILSSINGLSGLMSFDSTIKGGKAAHTSGTRTGGIGGFGYCSGGGGLYDSDGAVYVGGGSGGGYVILIANEIEIKNTSSITANGAKAANSMFSGGGAGGIIYFAYSDSFINNGTQTVSGGTGFENGSDGVLILEQI